MRLDKQGTSWGASIGGGQAFLGVDGGGGGGAEMRARHAEGRWRQWWPP